MRDQQATKLVATISVPLPHSGFILDFQLIAEAENIGSSSLQDGATMWLYYATWISHPAHHSNCCTLSESAVPWGV